MTSPTTSPRTIVDAALFDVFQELAITRRHLERVPDDRLDWRPHPKSKTLGELATHLAWIVRLPVAIATMPELDFNTGPGPVKLLPSRDAMLAVFDEHVGALQQAMAGLEDAALAEPWTLRTRGNFAFSDRRGHMLRTLGVSHIIHHRAQLGVYLRLLDVAVPSSYGPSADE